MYFYYFMMYTICSFFGALYIFFFIPETKGKTLQQIQIDLNTKKIDFLISINFCD